MNLITTHLLRIICIVAVLIIHVTSPWEYQFIGTHSYISESFLAILLNQMSRFCVPVFIILSGYGLGKKYQNNKKTSFSFLKKFAASRFKKILLPYIVWSVLFIMIYQVFIKEGFQFKDFINALLTGSADYHFYFFIIIIQCYILFVFLKNLNSKALLLLLLLAHLFFTSPSHFFLPQLGISRPHFHSAFFVFWIFYFYAGIFIAKNEISIINWVKQRSKIFILSFFMISLSIVLGEYIYFSNTMKNPGYFNHFNRYSIVLYSIATIFLFYKWDIKITGFFNKHKNKHQALTSIAALTFAVYIFHTIILRLLSSLLGTFELFILIFLLIGLSFLLAFILSKIFKKQPWLKNIFGLF